ncbi:hypothetical protein PP182_19900 [Maribacter sp. PR1]|uniref:General secretion pathway protein n=1 Tax=Maribacter cobaltidurans TaxID=1178778 RepID=A0ABU7IZC0_9FLAO|nr:MULTISPECIES: hypothetical protein [Maribacter]MDC6390960.1 hypothetical protein [Maribacter sp. PR1]MEE1978352.1 hypothetical protein [Maribacter cobaltidurans]
MFLDKRNKLLLGGILLLLVASYYLAIDKTFAVRRQYIDLSQEVGQFSNLPQKLGMLEQQEVYYDSILTSMDIKDTSFQNTLLKALNQEAEKLEVKVMDFNRPHTYLEGDTQYETYQFALRGSFSHILKVLYTLERKGNYGELVHVNFEKKKDYRSQKEYLEAKVFMLSVK